MMNVWFGNMMSGFGGVFTFMGEMMRRMFLFLFGWL